MTNLSQTEWSSELREKLKLLPPRQSRLIVKLVAAEAQGAVTNRLLSTTYSCLWCGTETRNKAARERHQARCKRQGQAWQFVTSHKQFYRYCAMPEFRECLELARQETYLAALNEARRLLQLHAPKAVRELGRQVTKGERDSDRRAAAIAILDRAGLETGPKLSNQGQVDQLSFWLEELRGGGEN